MIKSKFIEPLAVAIASGSKLKDAAELVGCSNQHAYNLSRTDQFQRTVGEIRTQAIFTSVGKLTNATNMAVETLVELLNPSNEPRDRLAAAKAILASVAPMSELGELRQRLDKIDALESKKQLQIAG